jgi:cytoskeletal protein CcmA (bactofilin family)
MAVFSKNEDQSKEMESVIGSSVHVEGAFVGAGDVLVEGRVSGSLKTKRNLRIGAGAVVKADLEAANMLLAGEVRGQIKCSGKVELSATAKIYGNVDTQSIAVAHGAILHGKVTMSGTETAPSKEAKGRD